MNRAIMVLVLVMTSACAAMAASDGRVLSQDAQRSGVVISASAPVTVAAGALASDTDALYLTDSSYQSVGVTASVTQTVSVSLAVQYSDDGGTTWGDFSPAVTVPMTFSATEPRVRAALDLPVCSAIRFRLGSDASYQVIYQVVNVRRW